MIKNKIYFIIIINLITFNCYSNNLNLIKNLTQNKSYRIFNNLEQYNLYIKKNYLECFKKYGIPDNLDFNNINNIITIRIGYYDPIYFVYNYTISNTNNLYLKGKNAESWSQSNKGFEIEKSASDKEIIVSFEGNDKGYIQLQNKEKQYFIKVENMDKFEKDFIDEVANQLNDFIYKNYNKYNIINLKFINNQNIKYDKNQYKFKTYLIWNEQGNKYYDNFFVIELDDGSILVLEIIKEKKQINIIDKQVTKMINHYQFQ